MGKIRVAVVGYGNIGRYALQALQVASDMEIAGVVRRNGDENKPAELADYAVVKDMKPGEISEPFESLDTEGRGNTIYKIVRLDQVTPAHVASFETDYDALVEMANEKNAHKAIDDFVVEKKKVTHIKIDPLFGGCKFISEDWLEK